MIAAGRVSVVLAPARSIRRRCCRRSASATIVDRNGEVLYESLAPRGTRGDAVDAGHLPPIVVDATLAAEDRRFYQHAGIDPIAALRAPWRSNIQARPRRRGRLDDHAAGREAAAALAAAYRCVSRSMREAVLALRLEQRSRRARSSRCT